MICSEVQSFWICGNDGNKYVYIVLMCCCLAWLISLPVQVYEVTIFEAEDEDSFDEDTEITEAVR